MRFFKYLIFTFFTFFILSNANALWSAKYVYDNRTGTGPTAAAACTALANLLGNVTFKAVSDRRCWNTNNLSYGDVNGVDDVLECFYPDYKIVSQPITSLKKTICLPVNGAICKYIGDPTGLPIINGSITTTFSSVSKASDPTCKEELVNPPCDPKDPYGGCFTPPDDGCTRQFNGSIECPPDIQPKVQKGCANGATYCDRPPQGCGEGYVSGSFNGKQICIKTSPSTGTGGDGSGGDGTGGDGSANNTGTGTGSSTSTNTTTNSDGSTTTNTTNTTNNFSIDFSPVVNAVNNVSEKLTNFKNELVTSISDLSNQIGLTNSKLDQVNANGVSQNSKQDQTNDLLQQIKDKIPTGSGSGDGSPSEQPASGASVDLTETNGLLTEIRDGIDSIKDVFSDEGKAELEQIGQPSNDSRYLNAEGNAQSSLNNLANKLTFGSSACLSDFQIQLPIFGSINIALSQWCPLLALLKILLNLIVLLTCLRMLDATVRTI